MTKRNAALEAIGRAPAPANVVPITAETTQTPAPSHSPSTTTADLPIDARAKVMLYLHPKVARKFKEIAFVENRKMHDVFLDALDKFLTEQGHGGLKGVIER